MPHRASSCGSKYPGNTSTPGSGSGCPGAAPSPAARPGAGVGSSVLLPSKALAEISGLFLRSLFRSGARLLPLWLEGATHPCKLLAVATAARLCSRRSLNAPARPAPKHSAVPAAACSAARRAWSRTAPRSPMPRCAASSARASAAAAAACEAPFPPDEAGGETSLPVDTHAAGAGSCGPAVVLVLLAPAAIAGLVWETLLAESGSGFISTSSRGTMTRSPAG